jgi:hypothetical protein
MIIGDTNNVGYYRVCLYKPKKKRYFRHRLVAEHFIFNDDPDNRVFVNHIDGDKSHNCISNLEWVTQSENELHAFKHGLKDVPNKVSLIVSDGNEKIVYPSVLSVARKYNADTASIQYLPKKRWILEKKRNIY